MENENDQNSVNEASPEDNEITTKSKHRLDRIYHVVKSDLEDEDEDDDDLILSMTVMENPPSGSI